MDSNRIFQAFDVETHIGPRGVHFPRLVCAATVDAQGVESGVSGPEAITQSLIRLIADEHSIAGTYLSTDMGCVLEYLCNDPARTRRVWDAMRAGQLWSVDIAQMLLDVAEDGRLADRYSLVSVANKHGHAIPEKDSKTHPWRMHFNQLDGVPFEQYPQGAREYVLDDVRLPATIAKQQVAADTHAVTHLVGQESWCQVVLGLVASHGCRTNARRVARLKANVEARIEGYLETLQQPPEPGFAPLVRTGKRARSKDKAAATAYMVELCRRQGRAPALTEKGQVSLDRDACILSGSSYMADYAEYTSAANLRAAAEDLEFGVDGPLQTSFKTLLVTGRTASSKPREPHRGRQMQNWPRGSVRIRKPGTNELMMIDIGARETCEPRDGCAYLWADFEGAETHTLAQACYDLFGFSQIGERLNAGIDEHTFFGAIAYCGGEAYESVRKRKDLKSIRNRSKPFTFGVPGGLGNDTFILFSRLQYDQLFTRDEVDHYRKLYFQFCPEVKQLHNYIGRLCKNASGQCTIRLPWGFTRAACYFPAAANLHFQAPCAAGAKAALCHVGYECYADTESPLYGFRICNFVHDEIVLEGPIAGIHLAGQRLRTIMCREFNRFTPQYPTGVEVIAGDAWSKSAKPVYTESGELGIWHYEEAA